MTRRKVWKLGGLTAGGFALTGLLGGAAWHDARNRPKQETGGEADGKTVRGSYDREEVQQLKACVDEDEMRGFGKSIDELLNPDEGRTVTRFEYVHDGSGEPSDVGSSIRYEVELEGTGETHELGWYKVENEVLEPFAEAKNYDGGLGEYAEENC